MSSEYYDEPPKRKNESVSYSWAEAWMGAVTRPGTRTFELLLADPQARKERGFLWVLITGFVAFIAISVILSSVLQQMFGGVSSGLGSLLCLAVIGGPIVLLIFIIRQGVIQFIATRVFHGSGTFEEYFYASACYYAPLMLVQILILGFSMLFGTMSVVFSILLLALGIYQIILDVIASKTVNQISWGTAGMSVGITFAAFLVLNFLLLSVQL